MQNCLFAYGNLIEASFISGGSYQPALPRSNAQNRRYSRVARTVDVQLTSTQLIIDAGTSAHIQVLALLNHNFGLEDRYRLCGCSEPTFTAPEVDSGWSDIWPAVYPIETLDFEAPNWWSGQYTPEELKGQRRNLFHILPAGRWLRYWRWEIDAQTNPAGYVQYGRAFLGEGWQPTYNMEYGAGLGLETKTGVGESQSGSERFNRRDPFRVFRFGIGALEEDEAMGKAYEVQRRMGIDGEVVFIWDPDDTVHAIRRRICGRFRTLSAIELPTAGFNRWHTGFEIKELQ